VVKNGPTFYDATSLWVYFFTNEKIFFQVYSPTPQRLLVLQLE